jgi:hypothetical protein
MFDSLLSRSLYDILSLNGILHPNLMGIHSLPVYMAVNSICRNTFYRRNLRNGPIDLLSLTGLL